MVLLKTGIAKAEPVPKKFKDSKIARLLDNGKVQIFDGNLYKIVKRTDSKAVNTKVIRRTIIKRTYITKQAPKNTLMFHAGYGEKAIVGISLQKRIKNKLSIGITGLNGKPVLLGLGVSF